MIELGRNAISLMKDFASEKQAEKLARMYGYISSRQMQSTFLRKMGRKIFRYFLPEDIEIIVGSSSRMVINPKQDGEWYICGYEDAEPGVAMILKTLNKGDCFVDVGAFVGYYSMIAREYIGKEGKILAFEPDPSI